jgi:hypothetical protein
MGNIMEYNSNKISTLYLVSSKPTIVWSELAEENTYKRNDYLCSDTWN